MCGICVTYVVVVEMQRANAPMVEKWSQFSDPDIRLPLVERQRLLPWCFCTVSLKFGFDEHCYTRRLLIKDKIRFNSSAAVLHVVCVSMSALKGVRNADIKHHHKEDIQVLLTWVYIPAPSKGDAWSLLWLRGLFPRNGCFRRSLLYILLCTYRICP